jgi:hypothetical protein
MDTSLGVVTVDGVKPFGLNRTMELHLLPGNHTIVLFYNSGGRQSTDNVTLHIQADAGRTYHIAAGATGGAWRPYIVPVR